VDDPNTQQVHDFEPGIAASGLFWTIPVGAAAVDVSPGSGRARFQAAGLAVPDFHDFFNAISPSPSPAPAPSHVSFDTVWSGGGVHERVRDTDFGFVGDFVAGDATIAFTVANDGAGVTYTSDAAGQTTASAGVGHERNGVFFS
jgi:hypothetical protein